MQARRLDRAGDQVAAIAAYRQAIAGDSNSYDAEYGLARALDLTGRYDEARQHFARALLLAPDGEQNQVLRMVGLSWTFSGDLGSADAEFRKVFDRQMAARGFGAAAEQANELGRLHLELGDPADAERWYRQGHDVAGRVPDVEPWQIDLAEIRWAHAQSRIAARRGQHQDAREHAAVVDALIAKGGNDDQRAPYAYLLGYLAFYRGDYAEAGAALAGADQKDAAVQLLRAQAAEHAGRPDDALACYRRAVQSTAHSLTTALARPIAERKLSAVER